jgi:hypothetical protein
MGAVDGYNIKRAWSVLTAAEGDSVAASTGALCLGVPWHKAFRRLLYRPMG